jgi:hypothetical protein
MLLLGGFKTVSSFKQAKKNGEGIDFNSRGFFYTFVMPTIYVVSFACSYYGVVG